MRDKANISFEVGRKQTILFPKHLVPTIQNILDNHFIFPHILFPQPPVWFEPIEKFLLHPTWHFLLKNNFLFEVETVSNTLLVTPVLINIPKDYGRIYLIKYNGYKKILKKNWKQIYEAYLKDKIC